VTTDMQEGRAQVMHRALNHCELEVYDVCDPTAHLDWHHRQSRRTGIHGPHNGLAACRPCHAWVHAHPEQARRHGWLVPTHTDPATVPATIRGTTRALTPGGTYA
jgi:hypothetical protein